MTTSRPASGWGVPVLLALITAGFSVLSPMLLIFLPLAFLLLALPERRPWLMAIAAALLVASFAGGADGVLWWYGRGWALILSAWFVLAIALLPNASLMSRALAALGGATASVALLFLANRNGWYQLDWAVGSQLRSGAAEIVSFWGRRVQDRPWSAELTAAVYRFTDFQASAFPALLAVASLAGLGLAWWFWRRLATLERVPLGRLRDFRFRDELIWLVVIGAALVALPLAAAPTRTGINLLTFMGALYAVRGAAVVLALFGTPGIFGALFGAFLFLMLYPIVMATTLMIGISDTWLDLRARRLTRQDDEKH